MNWPRERSDRVGVGHGLQNGCNAKVAYSTGEKWDGEPEAECD